MKYSIVIPLKNEEENIKPLVAEVEPVMQTLAKPWEIIFIDDGSTDETGTICEQLTKDKPNLRLLTFSKNFGQSSAFAAGFEAAKGDFVITMDGDRQNDPKDIPKLIEAIQNADLVCGIRAKRKDPLIKRFISRIANKIRSRACQDGMQDTGCSLKVYRNACLRKIKMFEGMHRFLPALFTIEGFRTKQVPVNHRERSAGISKYGFRNRSLNTIFDLLAVVWMRKRHLGYQVKKEQP